MQVSSKVAQVCSSSAAALFLLLPKLPVVAVMQESLTAGKCDPGKRSQGTGFSKSNDVCECNCYKLILPSTLYLVSCTLELKTGFSVVLLKRFF